MADPRGRRATWTAALLLAPGTAGLLGATVWWSSATTPTVDSTPNPAPVTVRTPATQAQPTVSAQGRELAKRIAAERQSNARLQRQLLALRRELATTTATTGTTQTSPILAAPAPIQAAPRPAPVQQPVYTPPPARPPVHATTGASGSHP